MDESRNEIADALTAYYRTLQPPGRTCKIAGFVPLRGGRQHEMYAFDLVSRSHNKEHIQPAVLRLYDGGNASETALFEYTVMQRVFDAGVAAPKVFTLEREHRYLGRPFVVMERLEGDDLSVFCETEVKDNPSWIGSREAEGWIDKYAALLASVHRLDWKAFGPGFFRKNPWSTDMDAGFFKSLSQRGAASVYEFYAEMEEWLGSAIPDARNPEVVLLHYDFHPGNVMVDGNRITGLLDWCEVCVGDPAFDVAWSNLLLLGESFETFCDPFVKAYKRQSGRELQNLTFYEVAAGIRQFCDLLRMKEAGAASLGKHSDAAELYNLEKELALTGSFLHRRTGIDLGCFLR